MMDFFGYEQWGKKVLEAMEQLLVEKKTLTPDLGGTATTEEVGEEIVSLLRKM